jgi:hypothetical protein
MFISFPVDEKKRIKEKSYQNNTAIRAGPTARNGLWGTDHGNGCTPAVLTGRRLLIAAYANSQQILKQVQDDRLREVPVAICVENEEGHARASIQSCPEKPSKHLWPFSVAILRGCFVSFGVT